MKLLQICKISNKFPDVRKHRREVINGNVRIFQDERSFMDIKVRRKNGRRHYPSFRKAKVIEDQKFFFTHDDAHLPWISVVSLFRQCNQDYKNNKFLSLRNCVYVEFIILN